MTEDKDDAKYEIERLQEVVEYLKKAKANNSLKKLETARLLLLKLSEGHSKDNLDAAMFSIEYENIAADMDRFEYIDRVTAGVERVLGILEKSFEVLKAHAKKISGIIADSLRSNEEVTEVVIADDDIDIRIITKTGFAYKITIDMESR